MGKNRICFFAIFLALLCALLMSSTAQANPSPYGCSVAEDGIHQWEVYEHVDSTAELDGYTSWRCTLCGEWSWPEIEHNWLGWERVQEPTCTERGILQRRCTRCTETDIQYIDPLPHAYTEHLVVSEATCTQPQIVFDYCPYCEEGIKSAVGEPLGHLFDGGVITVEPTCVTEGLVTFTCSRCGATTTEVIAATGVHTPTKLAGLAPTCESYGYTEGSFCSVCGQTLEGLEELPPLPHTRVDFPGIQPTCTEPGRTAGTYCEVCRSILDGMDEIPATGHTPVYVEAEPPTCTEPGFTAGSYCSVCEIVLEGLYDIPATGHTPVSLPGKAATLTEAGLTDGTVCSVCGAVLEAQTEIPPLSNITLSDEDAAVFLPALFSSIRGILADGADTAPIITSQPENSEMSLTATAEGGTKPYTYEWHYIGDSATSVNPADSVHTYNSAKTTFAEAFDSAMTALDPTNENVPDGSSYSRGSLLRQEALAPVTVNPNDMVLEDGDKDIYAAVYSGRYYCVIRDAGGHRIVTDEVMVIGEDGIPTGKLPEFNMYSPADLQTDVTPSDFNGYWVCKYIQIEDVIFSGTDLDDRTDVIIDAPHAALGGPLFGDVLVDMEFTDNALRFTAEDITIILELQQDGYLRMTLTAPETNMILYLEPVLLEADSAADD